MQVIMEVSSHDGDNTAVDKEEVSGVQCNKVVSIIHT